MSDERGMLRTERGRTPDPDPTILTTQQSAALREEMYRAIGSATAIWDARIHALEEATNRFRENLSKDLSNHVDTIKELLEEKVRGFRDNVAEKFEGVERQFHDRDARLELIRLNAADALNAAFAARERAAAAAETASKEAISKSELATKEKIVALQALLSGGMDDIRGQIGALTSRLDRGEGAQRGSGETKHERRAEIGSFVALAAFVLGIINVIIIIVVGIATIPHAPAIPITVAPPPASSTAAPR